MKFFIDTANVEDIRKINEIGLLDGVTTNPTLIAKEGRIFEEVIAEIASIVDGPISGEVISLESEGMVKEARELVKIHKNIVVKIPMTQEGLKAVKVLSKEGIKTNVTLIFSAAQALLAAKAGATYVSPFIGRLEDVGQSGLGLIEEIVVIFQNYNITAEVICASIRSVEHVVECAMLGAHIATIPPKIMHELFKHELTDKGIQMFMDDWNNTFKK